MSDDLLIDARHVGKKYCRQLLRSLWYGAQDVGAELLGRSGDRPLRQDEFWAIDDVSFQLRRGQSLGLVGGNGAGKSTLLKMLSGLVKPDAGSIRMRGRVAGLIELGAGFHPLLSGLENIYVNAAILGMPKRVVDRRLEEIVAFADIGDAIDAPVQTYSSGMRVRLGFAVAAHLDPDILLIDEVLAVGDVSFRSKCYRHLAELRRRGCAFILVSHSDHVIRSFCDLGLLLRKGRSVAEGPIDVVQEAYARSHAGGDSGETGDSLLFERSRRSRELSTGLDIVRVGWEDADGRPLAEIRCGDDVILRVDVVCHREIAACNVFFAVREAGMDTDFAFSTDSERQLGRIDLAPGRHAFTLRLEEFRLRPGRHSAKLYFEEPGLSILDVVDWSDLPLTVVEPRGNEERGVHPHLWTAPVRDPSCS